LINFFAGDLFFTFHSHRWSFLSKV
jgi:hypothetical protein